MTISKINLTLEQDWIPVIKKFEYLKNLLKDYSGDKGTWVNGYNEFRYDFGSHGSFMFFDSITADKKTAGIMTDNFLTTFLPWFNQMKEDLSPLNVASVGFQGNTGNLIKHKDGQEKINTTKHCKLNYIIDDFTDVTYTQDDLNNIYTYPSTKNSAWLIDTTKEHWSDHNSGPRYIFQLAFHQDFNEVDAWFREKNALAYK